MKNGTYQKDGMMYRCIHVENDICYCGCPECAKDCSIEAQKLKGGYVK